MNKNTVKAIQKRIDSYRWKHENFPHVAPEWERFDIGNSRYVFHLGTHDLMPYVLKYSRPEHHFGYDANPVHVGNVIDWVFIPADFPERRGA